MQRLSTMWAEVKSRQNASYQAHMSDLIAIMRESSVKSTVDRIARKRSVDDVIFYLGNEVFRVAFG